MNGKIASERNSIFGPDGYEDTPQDMIEAYEKAVFIEDNFPPPEELKRELKRTITIRLDPDVYSWFQFPGAGYQTRINAVLRRYMELQKAAKLLKQPGEKKRSLSEVTKGRESVAGFSPKAKTEGTSLPSLLRERLQRKAILRTGKRIA